MNKSRTIGKALHAMFQVCDIPYMFLIWRVWGRASAIASLSHPGLLQTLLRES